MDDGVSPGAWERETLSLPSTSCVEYSSPSGRKVDQTSLNTVLKCYNDTAESSCSRCLLRAACGVLKAGINNPDLHVRPLLIIDKTQQAAVVV